MDNQSKKDKAKNDNQSIDTNTVVTENHEGNDEEQDNSVAIDKLEPLTPNEVDGFSAIDSLIKATDELFPKDFILLRKTRETRYDEISPLIKAVCNQFNNSTNETINASENGPEIIEKTSKNDQNGPEIIEKTSKNDQNGPEILEKTSKNDQNGPEIIEKTSKNGQKSNQKVPQLKLKLKNSTNPTKMDSKRLSPKDPVLSRLWSVLRKIDRNALNEEILIDFVSAAINNDNPMRRIFLIRITDICSRQIKQGERGVVLLEKYMVTLLRVLSIEKLNSTRLSAIRICINVIMELFQECVPANVPVIYDLILCKLIPVLKELLFDSEQIIAKTAANAVIKMSYKIDQADLISEMVPVLILMSHDRKIYRNTIAIKLFNSTAVFFGKMTCRTYFLAEIIFLSESGLNVKKKLASNLTNICHCIGPETTSKTIFPIYEQLVKDSEWQIRCKTPKSVIGIYQNIGGEEKTRLLRLFEGLLDDPVISVREKAADYFVPLACKLGSGAIPPSILKKYIEFVVESNVEKEQYASDFSLLASILGVSRWPEISQLFLALSSSHSASEATLMADSIPEISRIIGQKKTEETILPVFLDFLGRGGQVGHQAVKITAIFCTQINRENREIVLKAFLSALEAENNWRIRYYAAKQMPLLIQLHNVEIAEEKLMPLLLDLAEDRAESVRQVTSLAITELIEFFYRKERRDYLDVITQTVKGFGEKGTFNQRQLFAKICGEIAGRLPPESFEEFFAETFFGLAEDSVVNVRITLAKTVTRCLASLVGRLRERAETVLKKLSRDESSDVRSLINFPCY